MKLTWLFVIVFLLVSFLTTPVFMWKNEVKAVTNADGSFYVGVTFGSNSTEDAKKLIDKVSGYVNLFVVDSWDISGAPNSSALDQICDYAVKANMSVIVYFDFLFYNVTTNISSNVSSVYNASTWEAYGVTPWHLSWLNSAREKWGDKFLGVYLMDEPGGNQIDRGYFGGNNITFSGRPVSTFRNVSLSVPNYSDAANQYVQGINRNRSMQLLINTSYPSGLTSAMPVFTSDYALYWFDYKAGYDTIFTELGGLRGTNNTVQQIALCRGAALAQNKDWGAIITWASLNSPYLESGEKMLQDMTTAYNAGAKYVIVFNYPQGALTDEHYNAIKQFWTNIHTSLRTSNAESSQVALMLPQNYGWGMRDNTTDKIWGFWPVDNSSSQIWNNINKLIDHYGLKLDIIYDDPKVNSQNIYSEIYLWNSTISFPPQPSINSTSPSSSNLFAAIALVVAITCVSAFIFVKHRKQPKLFFPYSSVKAMLKGFGNGTFELEGSSLKFHMSKKYNGKRERITKEITLTEIDQLNRSGNQLRISRNSIDDIFVLKKSQISLVYEETGKAWINQKKTLEENRFKQEQSELTLTFDVVTKVVNSLFDALVSLHGKIDWNKTGICVKRYEEAALSSQSQIFRINPECESLYLAIKENHIEDSLSEIRRILESSYTKVLMMSSRNPSGSNGFHPNLNDFKTAIVAYYTLNDILLGEILGDEDLARETSELAINLNHLSQETDVEIDTQALLRGFDKQSGVKVENMFAERRALFLRQIRKILGSNSILNVENQAN